MQITDNMIKRYRDKFREFWPGSHPDKETSRELLEYALSALSLPVQPVAWPEPKFVPMGGGGMRLNPERVAMLRREINAELVLGEQIQLFFALGLSDYIEPSTTPPVPPTKGPEDDLIAAREVIDWIDAWISNPVGSYSTMALDGLFAMTRDRILALRSRPASALPVVGEAELLTRALAYLDDIYNPDDDALYTLRAAIRSALTPSGLGT